MYGEGCCGRNLHGLRALIPRELLSRDRPSDELGNVETCIAGVPTIKVDQIRQRLLTRVSCAYVMSHHDAG